MMMQVLDLRQPPMGFRVVVQAQQMEIHEQLLQHMGDGPTTAAGSDFGLPADDVYNPDDPAFL